MSKKTLCAALLLSAAVSFSGCGKEEAPQTKTPLVRTQTVALFSYVDPVAALLLSAAFLGERLTVPGLVGAGLILGAAVWCERKGT